MIGVVMKARISVIITSYNYSRYLDEAINSVLNQTRIPDELLLIDDGSIDDSYSKMLRYAEGNVQLIRVIHHQKNLGIVATFSEAVEASIGDYIVFFGADNYFEPDYIEKCSTVLDEDPHVAIAYTDYVLFGPRAEKVYSAQRDDWKDNQSSERFKVVFPEFEKVGIEELRKNNFIHGSSMYRRLAYFEVGGYKQVREGGSPEDHNLFVRILSQHKWTAVKVPDTLIMYRQHSEEQANIKVQNIAKARAYDDVVAHWQRDVAELRCAIAQRDQRIKELELQIELCEQKVMYYHKPLNCLKGFARLLLFH